MSIFDYINAFFAIAGAGIALGFGLRNGLIVAELFEIVLKAFGCVICEIFSKLRGLFHAN